MRANQALNIAAIKIAGREVQICAAVLLLAALAPWPYGYYQFLRLAVCMAAAVSAWRATSDKRTTWVVLFVGLALLFNPLKTVHFSRTEWAWIDAIAALLFLAFTPTKKKEDL